MNDDINHISPASPDFQTELAEKLAELAPEAIADGKIDVEKLKELLDGDAEDSNERFGLFWPGKKRALRAAQRPTTATLKPDLDNSKDWDTTKNVFIEGDNLEVLKVLQKHYHGKIKMIYIDPPYNTGKDFVYPDNFKEGLDTYLEWTKQVNQEGEKLSSNSESEGRYHSNWLNMMYPRLKLARNLLTDDGVIFISIDDNEVDNLLRLAKEIFGENRFIAQFPWRKQTAKSDVPFGVSQDYEWIIAFAKGGSFKARTEGKPRKYFQTPDLPGRRWRVHDLTKQTSANERPKSYFVMVDPKNGKEYPPNPNRTWAITVDTFEEYYAKKRIVFPGDYDFLTGSQPLFRYFEDEDAAKAGDDFGFKAASTQLPDDVGMTKEGGSEIVGLFGSKVFSFPKPSKLIQHLVDIATRKDDIVLDLFSGSSSTAQAVLQLNARDGGNRRHIQVQLPEPTPENSEARKASYGTVAELSRERIRRAGEKIKQDFAEDLAKRDTSLDVGFRAYKLSDTNFTKWQMSSDTPANELEQHLLDLRESANDNATADDLLTELLLKQGYSLTEKIGHDSIAGLDLKTVFDTDGDVAVLAYLDEHFKPTLDQLRQIADFKPVWFVILEDCFQGDDELKTNLVQICKTNGVELWTA